jgi:hypothetical protein
VTLRHPSRAPFVAFGRRAIYITTLAGLSACATVDDPPEPNEELEATYVAVVEPTGPSIDPEIDPDLLYDLLTRADQALADDRLTAPAEDSALSIYSEILALDPDSESASRGFERIVERYIALALQALERRQYVTARSMLARGRLINSTHPSIEPTAEQIRLLSTAKRTKLNIDGNLQDDELQQKLRDLAQGIEGFDCRYVIWAKSDAQGRRIYQAMRNGENRVRVRAQILIRMPVSVEQQCFPTAQG